MRAPVDVFGRLGGDARGSNVFVKFEMCNNMVFLCVSVCVYLQLDSFALWLLHRKIRFTANNFFTVDLTLVYAVSKCNGCPETYLFYFI